MAGRTTKRSVAIKPPTIRRSRKKKRTNMNAALGVVVMIPQGIKNTVALSLAKVWRMDRQTRMDGNIILISYLSRC